MYKFIKTKCLKSQMFTFIAFAKNKQPSGSLGELEVKSHPALTNHLPAF